MKRDPNLMLKIAKAVEDAPDPYREAVAFVEELASANGGREVLYYHVTLMEEEGLVKTARADTHDGPGMVKIELTSPGHDFLTRVRRAASESPESKRVGF